jgi:hypothetical protein
VDEREVAAAAFMTRAFAGVVAPDSVVIADGLEVRGAECAAHLAEVFAELDPDSIDLESVNGEQGLAIRRGGRVVGVAVLGMRVGRVTRVWLVTAPGKLTSWALREPQRPNAD